jgi:hypothetical protein
MLWASGALPLELRNGCCFAGSQLPGLRLRLLLLCNMSYLIQNNELGDLLQHQITSPAAATAAAV